MAVKAGKLLTERGEEVRALTTLANPLHDDEGWDITSGTPPRPKRLGHPDGSDFR